MIKNKAPVQENLLPRHSLKMRQLCRVKHSRSQELRGRHEMTIADHHLRHNQALFRLQHFALLLSLMKITICGRALHPINR